MINSVEIENFQSHKNTKLEFDKVNFFIGESDNGKTGVFRAIAKAVLNTPRGVRFVRHGTKNAKVSIDFDDMTLVRERGTVNKLWIDDVEFEAIGNSDYSDEIVSKLAMNEINFAKQLDPMFLLSETGGKAAEMINKHISVEGLLQIQKDAASAVRSAESALEYTQHRSEEIEGELESLPDRAELQAILDKHKKTQESLKNLEAKNTVLSNVIHKLAVVQEELQQNTYLVAKPVFKLYVEKQALIQSSVVSRLSGIISKINETEWTKKCPIVQLRDIYVKYIRISSESSAQSNCLRLKHIISGITSKKEEEFQLKTLLDTIPSSKKVREDEFKVAEAAKKQKRLQNMIQNIQFNWKIEKEIKPQLEELKKQVCPTCGQPWSKA